MNETDHLVNNSAITPKYEMHQNTWANGSEKQKKKTENRKEWNLATGIRDNSDKDT